ncbi:SEP-domain-containing protein [Annulohypoxylon maeteangense]|uniref:SEP-domain-containing protein n=1 Tax=Annulohypoxylon maeteangense TaxID=1927788 RepID=UPI00200884AB|nr:SEP-domain-containing protein [Annulohypoxylon maeteangense]KAI0883040.1 SEP-domain-containing protein [Annulohypoxylon maeteangense]
MASSVDHDALTSELIGMTGASAEQATQYLSACNWDLAAATQAFFADEEDGTAAPLENLGATSSSSYTGPRTLDGRPAPQAIPTTSSSSKRPPKKKGLATLSSLGGGHDHDDDDDDEDDEDIHRDTYAGGEKSGLAVQDPSQRSSDPRRILNDLLAKAKSNSQRPDATTAVGPSSSSFFRGSGQTLGGEGTPSRTIPDPSGHPAPSSLARPQGGEVQERTLHLWRDGFSIDDGDLRRFDDPQNTEALRMIQEGRAPIQLMNVRYDEPLDVKLQQHDEEYRVLPKVYKPFGGEGRRLGSPVPGESAGAATTTTTLSTLSTSSTPGTAAASSSSTRPSTSVDESQPTIMIRIQMPDGTRLPARFNTSHTVNDVYDFISRSSPALSAGGWVLATTFPNKDHTDKSLVLGDMAEFKKGGTAMVKRNK